MAKKLVIVMANTDPRNGEELGAPLQLNKKIQQLFIKKFNICNSMY